MSAATPQRVPSTLDFRKTIEGFPPREDIQASITECDRLIKSTSETVAQAKLDKKAWQRMLKFIDANAGTAPKKKRGRPKKVAPSAGDGEAAGAPTADDQKERDDFLQKCANFNNEKLASIRAELLERQGTKDQMDDDEIALDCIRQTLAQRLNCSVDEVDERLGAQQAAEGAK